MKPRPNQSFVALGLLLVGCGGASAPSDGERQATAHLVEQAPLQGLTPEAARAVERLGPQVWGHAESGALVGLYGLGLRAVQVEDPLDVEAAEVAVRRFLSEHPALYGVRLEQLQPEALTLETVRQTDRLSFDLQQRSAGLEVTQGLLIVSFDVQGRLQSIVGRLVPQEDLPAVLTPTLSAAEVGAHAMAGAAPGSQLVDARLRIDVARGGLVYDARVLGRTQDEVRVVDASTGEILTTDEQIAHLESERIRMRYYYHPGGSRTLDSQAFTSPLVDIPVINTSWGRLCVYQLQRDRVGGLRIWNGKGITASTPEFSRPQFLRRCGDTSGVFDVAPDSSSDDRFNQQQTYLWAERFADAVDDWGRQANRYGHYPMDTNRPTQVDVVVNADPGNEVNWCGSGVQHGCFRRSVSSSWFRAHPQPGVNIPAVYLFSQAGNSASYHYIGNEHSPTYAIIAHEIGHYVTWTYGGFRSASESSGPMRRTLSEGFSMLYPMLMGLDRWPTSVSFEDVVTGRLFDDPLDSATTIQRHTDLSCSADPYELAEPFLQAMWRLMNNRDMNGAPIWAADALAREAVADRLMHALFTHGNNTQATWVTIAFDVLNRTSEAIYTDYTDVVATPGQTLLQIVGVFNAHGLLSTCNP